MTPNGGYKETSVEFDLGKEDPAIGSLSQWEKDREYYFGIRFYYTDRNTGELRPGRNGITVLAGYAIDLIKALIHTYNLATGNEYVLATKGQLKDGNSSEQTDG